MATKKSTASKKKLTPGDTGIDRWTSNGYGIVNVDGALFNGQRLGGDGRRQKEKVCP